METDVHLTSSCRSQGLGLPEIVLCGGRLLYTVGKAHPNLQSRQAGLPHPRVNVFELFLLKWKVVSCCVKRKVTLPLWPLGSLCSQVEDMDMSSVCMQGAAV